jgi:hypothetical protein
MSKLTIIHINIIGVVVGLLLAGILWFTLIKPKNEDIETTTASAKTTEDSGGTEEKIKQKERDLASTKVDAAKTDADWNVNVVKYMPSFPYNDKTNDLDLYFFPPVGKSSKGQLYGFRDIPTVWGQWITAWYDAQRNQGVAREPGTEFPILEFQPDPNQLTRTLNDHLTFPGDGKTWPVRLQCKSFDEAMNHLRRFNNMEHHGMPVISNVTLAGQSPNLELQYDMAMYIIPRTPPPVIDPMIGGGTGAPGATPGMGRGGPGFPGASGMPGSGGMGGSAGAMGGTKMGKGGVD